ncbi:MAG: chorismate mutase [Spirochaetaceae bacterium]|jgi:chorismate mutase|nr:chorismate mutase [Spirochaetaceae bacterium]
MKRLFGLRGAVQSENTEADIIARVSALYDELLLRNNMSEEDVASIIFSMTPDLDAQNPAAALRRTGRAQEAALFTAQEARIQGGLDRVIRVLLHCYLEEDAVPYHVYQNGAEILRPDRAAKDKKKEE